MDNMQKRIHILLLVLLSASLRLLAQSCGASGMVVDAETGETLPMVQIFFIDPNSTGGKTQTRYGTTSDLDGQFSLSNNAGYNTIHFQMIGYKTEMLTLRKGQTRENLKIKMHPDVYGLQDIVVTPKHRKREYKKKGNPAVLLMEQVIAHKDSGIVQSGAVGKTEGHHYTATTYDRMSFAMDNFHPNFNKGIWKTFNFIEKYIDTTSVYPSLTMSIREHLGKEYYQLKPHREKKVIEKKRIFGIEDVVGSSVFQENVDAVFRDVDLREDDLNMLFNRFVSPLNKSIATTFYQFYIMDTVLIDGYSCVDMAFVPVNSESYGFTGHLYIVNDSTYKIKRYAINIPPAINLNFVSDFSIECSYEQLGEEAGTNEGLWYPERTTTYAKFYIFDRKTGVLARQTKIYTDFDFTSEIEASRFSPFATTDPSGRTGPVRVPSAFWDTLRPEPLTRYETAVSDLVKEFEANPLFNRLAQTVNALSTGFIGTAPIERRDSSKWDFGPIYSTYSWNSQEGSRLRIGGMTTPALNPRFYLQSYVAYGFGDKRPKGGATFIFTPEKHRWYPYDSKTQHFLRIGLQYDMEEPGQLQDGWLRDNIFRSIPTSKPGMINAMYVAHAKAEYEKEWNNHLALHVGFDYTNVEAAGGLSFDRIRKTGDMGEYSAYRFSRYNNYEAFVRLKYSPGHSLSRDRMGKESQFDLNHDAPVLSVIHTFGYLDDRSSGGNGFIFNRTEAQFDKRFWFSAFGCLDVRLMTGMVWQKVPFTKLFAPQSNTSIFLAERNFNLMQPMEFLFDEYVALYTTYYFKGWILNRIPGINRLKLRGVVSFSGIYGGLTDKNNPYKNQNEGLYLFPNNAKFDDQGQYVSGTTSSPIGKLPYMELTAGLENIFKVLRIDYVRRLTYNEYTLPDGIHTRKRAAWGRNGVKISVKFSL